MDSKDRTGRPPGTTCFTSPFWLFPAGRWAASNPVDYRALFPVQVAKVSRSLPLAPIRCLVAGFPDLRVLCTAPTPWRPWAFLLFCCQAYRFSSEPPGSPEFPAFLLNHAMPSDPGGRREPDPYRLLPVGFCYVDSIAIRVYQLSRGYYGIRSCGVPYGLVHSLCTLQSRVTLSTATLDSGGWLSLTTPGLTPRKKCRAFLGAPTFVP